MCCGCRESSCGDLVRCTLGDGVSLCPQRWRSDGSRGRNAEHTAVSPASRPPRASRSMLGIAGSSRTSGQADATAAFHRIQRSVSTTSWRGARAGQLRGRPAKRRLAALRLVAHHRRLEDAQNGDHTQLIRAHTPDAQRRQPRTGSTPHLGRGQQQQHGGRRQQVDARVRGPDREIGPVRHALSADRVDEHLRREDARAPRAAASQVPKTTNPGTTGAHTSSSINTEPPGPPRAGYGTHSSVARSSDSSAENFCGA